ncbi:MAG: HAD hydrolase-like protein [Candidatus Gribaldobacteria bacterium]|nr:HAD hydrolase-like protein [Candidatus Gribaldobacteria bacterium]
MNNILAVLFDADGTLIDSREWALKYYFLVAKELGLPEVTHEEFLAVWAIPWKQLLNALWPGVDVAAFNKACEKYDQGQSIPAIAGAKKVLYELKKKENFLSLISNRRRSSLAEKMSEVGMPFNLFDYVQAVDDFPFCKPNPHVFDPVLFLLSERDIPRSEVVFVGDTLSDLEAARGADIKFIGVLTGGATKQQFVTAGLDEAFILESVRDLPKFLT